MRSDPLLPLVTCEHAGNRIPRRYRSLFQGQEDLLASHRGWDPGALPLARGFSRRLDSALISSRVSRLLVDLNRSPRHPRLFSDLTRSLPAGEREAILQQWYRPHRAAVEAAVAEGIDAGRVVLHLAVHTFTPVLDGTVRDVDIGLLYDPSREGERGFCRTWKGLLVPRRDGSQSPRHGGGPPLRIRMNEPYRGTSDGLTTALRRAHPSGRYLGIELEVNQGLILEGRARWRNTRDRLLESISALFKEGA